MDKKRDLSIYRMKNAKDTLDTAMNQQVASKGIQLVDLQHMENMHLIHLLRMKKNLRN